MPTVKTQTFHRGGHHSTCTDRRKYLEQDMRHLDRICLNIANPERWAKEMDATREVYRLRGSVTYREFILSPDVADNADVGTVRVLAIRWCEENFPDAEAAIVLHDDNKERRAKGKEGIVHAHCVINTVDLETGRKVILSKPKVRELHNSAQRIGGELGLSVQPDYRRGERLQSRQSSKRTLSERQIELREATSWKASVRDMALQALSISGSATEFKACLDRADVDVTVDRGRIYLADRDNPTRACRADRLDKSLSAKNISRVFQERGNSSKKEPAHLEQAIKRELAQGGQMRREVQQYDLKCRKALDDYRLVAKANKGVPHERFPKFAMPNPKTEAEKTRCQEARPYFQVAANRARQKYEEPVPREKQSSHQQKSQSRNTASTPKPQRSISRGR